MSNIDHIILYLILFGASLLWSQANTSNRKNIGLIFAALFIFVIGSRTWGPDYAWYHYKVEHPNDLKVKDDEIGFQWLNAFIRFIGLNGDGAFYIYALILMIGTLTIINSYKKDGRYMCLLVIPAIMLQTSVHIRQGIAFSFALISFYFLRKNKKLYSFLFAFIAFNIHKIIIVLFFFYFICSLLSKKKIPIYIIIAIYTIATFIPQVINLDNFIPYLNFIQIGGKYEGYINQSEIMFSQDANRVEWQQSTIALILSFLYDISMFFIMNLCLKKQENKEIRTLFYLFSIGAIFFRFFFLNELLRRTFSLLYIFYFIPVGYALSILLNKKKYSLSKNERKMLIISICLMIIYNILYWGRFILANKDCNFLWT